MAEAFAAAGEVLARAGDFEGAHEKFVEAERHAIAAEYSRRLLEMRLLWAKVDARREAPDRESDHLRRAEALGHALEQAESPTHVAELEEAMGIVARAQGDHEKAIAHHRRAYELFTELERPLLAARALLGVGASEQLLNRFDEATAAYEKTIELYERLGVPERYRNRITAEKNLGAVNLADADARGLQNFGFVAEFGEPDERLEALAAGTNLAVASLDESMARRWAADALAELERQPQVSVLREHQVKLSAGNALFGFLNDPAMETLLEDADILAKQISLERRLTTREVWIEWLGVHQRCDDKARRLSELDIIIGSTDPPDNYTEWRRAQLPCAASERQ